MEARALYFAGLELGSERRTQIVCLKYFSQENKIFLDSFHDGKEIFLKEIEPDLGLIQFFNEHKIQSLGVDAPLSLPPCIECKLICPGIGNCKVSSVQWMQREYESYNQGKKNKTPIPYGQRPVDLLLKSRWKNSYVDQESGLSANRAPLAARMTYLKKHIAVQKLIEVNPRLSVVDLAHNFRISDREIRRYRSLEFGIESRARILEELTKQSSWAPHLFLYNSELSKIIENISIFDALICALMAVYDHANLLEEMPFSSDWGSVAKVKPVKKTMRIEEFY
ncbi:MAG: DUF429 domain-containing protein [Oligoflexia bacterium]|nr:DUF429 domain-containing protein [Oligoflexia bacterium]